MFNIEPPKPTLCEKALTNSEKINPETIEGDSMKEPKKSALT